jgi:hypothetical protein
MVKTTILARPDGWPMRCDEVYAAMGLPRRLPDHGTPVKIVQGIACVLEPKLDGINQDGNRLRAACPDCGRWFGFARLRQHHRACARKPVSRETV